MSTVIQRLCVLALLVGASAAAHATVISCPAGIADNVSGTQACAYSDSASQDFLNTTPLTVNGEAFFSYDDWVFAGKIGEDAGFGGQGSGSQGSWSLPVLDAASVMLVFKSGNGTGLVAYLVAAGVLSGSWSSPFENPPFSTLKDTKQVSHVSVYVSDEGFNVPLPATWLLLALPLAGLVLRRAR